MLNLTVTSRIHVQLLKLSCANCSAPLEIEGELERFACSYCGTEQIVKRSGGVVWLKKVETAIRAVQKGTDRTAAELALVRLDRELEEAQESKAALIRTADEKEARARGYRNLMAMLTLVAVFFLLPIVFVVLFGEKIEAGAWFFWFMACIFAPVGVLHWIKLPPRDDIQQSVAEIDVQIAEIEEQIYANRAILDARLA
ncbi:MAG: hypothetical protein V4679_12260 [Pseudomonadota bacterium]